MANSSLSYSPCGFSKWSLASGPPRTSMLRERGSQHRILFYNLASEITERYSCCIILIDARSQDRLQLSTGCSEVLEDNVVLECYSGHLWKHNLPLPTLCPNMSHPTNMQTILPPAPSILHPITASDSGLRSQIWRSHQLLCRPGSWFTVL